LHDCRRDERNSEYLFLIDEARSRVVSILTSLADGYNKYYPDDKILLYSKARSDVSHTQALLLLLGSLGIISTTVCDKIFLDFDGKINVFNGLIRKMESKA
jgi:hypothetical protein